MDWSVSEVRIPIPHGPAVAWLARQICAALFLEDDCNKSDPADEGDTREAGGICAAADIAADARDMQAVTINKVDDGDVTTSTDCSTIDELDGADIGVQPVTSDEVDDSDLLSTSSSDCDTTARDDSHGNVNIQAVTVDNRGRLRLRLIIFNVQQFQHHQGG
jgi:hypothetical protein